MTCEACTHAELEPTRYEFATGCRSCKARALAVTGAHLESQAAKAITAQYRQALETLFGADGWQLGHEDVKRWAAAVQRSRVKVAA